MARPAAVIAVIAVVVASAAAAVARVPCPVEFALGADGRRRPVRSSAATTATESAGGPRREGLERLQPLHRSK